MRKIALSKTLAPHGLIRTEAAAYIGVGPSLFDKMVEDVRMPRPKQINSLEVWDKRELDVAFDALPGDEEDHSHYLAHFLAA